MEEYELVWVDENAKYYDLDGTLLNYGPRSKKKFGFGVSKAFVFGRGTHLELHIEKHDLQKAGADGYTFFMNPENLGLFLEESKSAREDIVEKAKEIAKSDLDAVTDLQLAQTIATFGPKIGRIFTCYGATSPHAVAKIEKELLEFIKKQAPGDAPHLLSILATPRKRFVFLSDHPTLQPFNQTIEKEEASLDLRILSPSFKEEAADEDERNALIIKLGLPKELIHAAEVLSALSEERMKMRFAWLLALYVNEFVIAQLKKRFGIPKTDLRKYLGPELDQLLNEKKQVASTQLQERTKGIVKILNGEEITCLEGQAALDFLEKQTELHEKTTELTGGIASKGRAKGRTILLSYTNAAEHAEKISKMEKGQILITEMTHPDIVVACKKAGAIVTDEGGTLCHAAIISRELGIPCLTGTKRATKTFKDGDLVEVDAEKGKIRKVY